MDHSIVIVISLKKPWKNLGMMQFFESFGCFLEPLSNYLFEFIKIEFNRLEKAVYAEYTKYSENAFMIVILRQRNPFLVSNLFKKYSLVNGMDNGKNHKINYQREDE